ncbi:type I site-specific deoxyribonuclease chain S [Streptococcus pneumoniae]|nr:type I site-specific deoxyribonuclease chain S [Streptococcus pneumoniae]
MVEIVRGGSPRPIKDYLTSEVDGINWIKILKRIKAEKEKLISEGKIKRDKKETEIFRGDDGKHYGKFADGSTQEIDVPYDIPDTWEWVRIKSIYWNFGQNKPEKSFRYIDTSSIDRKKNIINYKNLQYLSPEQAPSRARKLVSQNSVLFSTVRPYLKNIAVVRELKEYLIASTAFIVLDTLLNETYLKYYLLSDNFINRVNNKSTGTSYPAINDYNFNLLLIALPPLSEQQRIVEAIESALEKVDEYAESYNRLEQLDKEFPDKIKKSGLNKTRFVKKGTFLLTNSMSFGRPYILNVDGAIHDGWLAISNYENSLNKDYLFYILSSNVVYSQFLSLISGAVVKNLNSDKVASILIPLPPLAEQQRIIEAIESALEKVDEYAESYNRLEQLDKKFPDKLKKSILQYAMQGKLVEQDPNDESVEVLLEKIRAEKQKLFEEGKIKKKDLDISIVSQGDDNSYYEEVPCEIPESEIPESWEWVRLNDITSYIQRGKSPKYSNIPIYPVIAQKCNQWSGFSIDLARFIDPETVHSYQKERLLRDGDLMWNSTGLGTLGRLAIYHENKNPYGWAVADSHVTVIRVLSGVINCHFIYNFLSSPIVQSVIEEKASGSTKQKELLTKTIKEYLIPLPPLPEQSRIVDKIEQFFAHIDALI